MIAKIDEKLKKEVEKLLEKEDLTDVEVQVLLAIKNDLKFEEKMKTMFELAY